MLANVGRLLNHGYCKKILVNAPVCLMEVCVLKYLLNFDIVDLWNSRTPLGLGVSIDWGSPPPSSLFLCAQEFLLIDYRIWWKFFSNPEIHAGSTCEMTRQGRSFRILEMWKTIRSCPIFLIEASWFQIILTTRISIGSLANWMSQFTSISKDWRLTWPEVLWHWRAWVSYWIVIAALGFRVRILGFASVET